MRCNNAVNETRIERCLFQENYAGEGKSTVWLYSANAFVDSCIFLRNTALERGGAAFVRDDSVFVNCLFVGNEADGGGAICVQEVPTHTQVEVINCTLAENPRVHRRWRRSRGARQQRLRPDLLRQLHPLE